MTTLHEELKDLHDRMQNPENWNISGICEGLTDDSELRDIVKRWDEFSGSSVFPISHPEIKIAPSKAYFYFDDEERKENARYMWDRETSPYAAARWRLLEWAIEQTKPERE